jgi:hypothetical protein
MQTVLQAITRTLTRCLVCGFTEVRTDEVVERGVVLLHECPRCQHRWTRPLEPARPETPARIRVPVPSGREVPAAA